MMVTKLQRHRNDFPLFDSFDPELSGVVVVMVC